MTEEVVQNKPVTIRRFERIELQSARDYGAAKQLQVLMFGKLVHESSALLPGPGEFEAPDFRVKVKRRKNSGRESFDVIAYRRLKSGQEKKSG